jgi:hypothetical protein
LRSSLEAPALWKMWYSRAFFESNTSKRLTWAW